MAFNFNWSPLMADANFYKRAQEMLTTALNKSPKPPIIVDHIIVNELNLGSVPPELEILEIGDLAEDRFRGIFRMCYSGDAFLTLKTKVQANPLNTYLSSTSTFTSPQPLAAASGLMIPLQITLSQIKLSAFIILVFSRQKGLTLVFRNDPLESLKVSSTFDSIPFVRNYLQKEIEIQLRTLMMDELPAIIHRLSLQLWCPEYSSKDYSEIEHKSNQKEEIAINPFATPPQDAVDFRGNVFDPNEISSLSSDGSSEVHLLFSQKNLLRLSALMDSHRTLSLFTPSIRDAVFRAWATPSDRGETAGTTTPASPALKRSHSTSGSTSTSYNFNWTSEDGHGPNSISTCPTILSFPSTTGLCLGSTRNARSHLRKKKKRVVNLRKPIIQPALEEPGNDINDSEKTSSININPAHTTTVEQKDKLITPPHSPPRRLHFKSRNHEFSEKPFQLCFSNEKRPISLLKNFLEKAPPVIASSSPRYGVKQPEEFYDDGCRTSINDPSTHQINKPLDATPKAEKIYVPSTLLKQSWVLKMASEILKRAQDEKARDPSWYQLDKDDTPPPAYEPKSFQVASPKKF